MKNLRTLQLLLWTSGTLLASLGALFSATADQETAALEFFETKVRPILVDNCYQCHSSSSEKVKGGLLLDTRKGLLKGGDTGPALVPGDPEKSLLIKAVRYADENLQMPPKNKKLSAGQIADLESWIKIGAPDPRSTDRESRITSNAQTSATHHWAFQPVQVPTLPVVKDVRWAQSPIDSFILAKLEEKGMKPSRKADKRTLIRRATFDLIGLPPTPDEVSSFLFDQSEDAFDKVVGRLLASPHYGERWARHWLDVARYSDSKGYVFEEERRYPYAYTYRDYVIRAFNEDLPYDQFIIQQIAADRLELAEDKRPLAALGFLTLGRRFLNNQHDIIDDRIDVVTRGTMALTVSCARCHDHKYDPIPTQDYYSLYGIFASSSEPAEKPLLGLSAQPKEYPEYKVERNKREKELNNFREPKISEARNQLRQRAGEYLLAAYESQRLGDKSKAEALARERKLDPGVVQRWVTSLESWQKTFHPIFTPWFAFARIATNKFEVEAKEIQLKFNTSQVETNTVNPLVAKAFSSDAPSSMKEVADRYGKLFAAADKQWQELVHAGSAENRESKTESSPACLADPDQETLRLILYAPGAPANLPVEDIPRLFDVPTVQKVRALKRKLEELDATHRGAPPRAMALQDNSKPTNPHVFLRGNPRNRGSEVPRQFLAILAGEKREPFQKGSGRLELAQAIASAENPLTARVFVNRVWLQHFGSGIVRTPSDFGLRSENPSHRELLDYLAWRFMEGGWSIKKLHRLIMLSSAYQQVSDDNPHSAQIDPNNQLLWRMNRRRLEFEAMRDTLLAVSGQIDLTAAGQPVDITTKPFVQRRTIYGFVERQNLPGLFRTFDFASPDTTSPQRYFTTVPQQALFLMNSPFLAEQARHLVEKSQFKSGQREEERIGVLYQLAYQRSPGPDEIELGLEFLHIQVSAPLKVPEIPAWQYGYGEFDEISRRVTRFQPLPHFTGSAWQGSGKLPDKKLGWVTLTAEGGHVGDDLQHAAIRRWIAPHDAFLSISGTLKHESEQGDGIRGRIVSSRSGELGTWTVRKGKENTNVEHIEVKKSDTIDFVTDCYKTVDSDAFLWSPTIKMTKVAAAGATGAPAELNAKADFSGPKEQPKPLDAWEKFAQVLLMSNELVYVD